MAGVSHGDLNTAARTCKRHRAEIRSLFGYREATVADAEMLSEWLRDQAAVVGGVPRLGEREKPRAGAKPPHLERASIVNNAAAWAESDIPDLPKRQG